MTGSFSDFVKAMSESALLRNGMLAGVLAGGCCAALSPLVVLRRMAFAGDGMAHASFGGMGLALVLLPGAAYDDPRIYLLTIVYCLVLGFWIARASRHGQAGHLGEDSAIGIAFAASMALGALCISIRQRWNPHYVPPMDNYLFGSLFNLTIADVILLAAVAVFAVTMLWLFFKEILFYVFDPRLAEASGVPAGPVHYVFVGLLVLTVVAASRVAGIVLVSASLVLPGVAAFKLVRRLAPAIWISIGFGAFSFALGVYISFFENIQPGSAIVLVQCLLLSLAFFYRQASPWTDEGEAAAD